MVLEIILANSFLCTFDYQNDSVLTKKVHPSIEWEPLAQRSGRLVTSLPLDKANHPRGWDTKPRVRSILIAGLPQEQFWLPPKPAIPLIGVEKAGLERARVSSVQVQTEDFINHESCFCFSKFEQRATFPTC
jgi:hypothetical protein